MLDTVSAVLHRLFPMSVRASHILLLPAFYLLACACGIHSREINNRNTVRQSPVINEARQESTVQDSRQVPAQSLPPEIRPLSKGDWLRIRKAERRMYLYRGSRLLETFPISLGYMPVGAKEKRDDYKTPEGKYFLCERHPKRAFHRALRISYPNAADAERGFHAGLISNRTAKLIKLAERKHTTPPQNTALGGDLFIHGGGVGKDWTWGCIALENGSIDLLYTRLPLGTRMIIEE